MCKNLPVEKEAYYWSNKEFIWNTKEDKQRVTDFLDSCDVDDYETNLSEIKRARANKRKSERIEKEMSDVPCVTEDMERWLDEKVFPGHILFSKREGKGTAYICTACKRSGSVKEKWKHKEIVHCPKCNQVASVNNRQKQKVEHAPVVILQKCNNRWVERQFKAVCRWSKEGKVIELFEQCRAIIPMGKTYGKVYYGTINNLLRKIDDNELYKQDGYKSIAEFAKAECGLSPSDTTRFIQINKKYSIGGNSEELRPEFLEYGQSKLAAMLALPDADLNMITPQTSREDIRELNRFNKSDPEQGADDDIEQLIRDFYVSQELVRKAVTVKDDPKALCELIAPSGSRSFRKGIWFILFHENKINIKKYSGVAKEISWEEFTKITAKVLEKYEPDDATREENTDGFKGDSKDNKQDSML